MLKAILQLNVLTTVFGVPNRTTETEICDMIRNEWKLYQTINAPTFLIADESDEPEVSDSYWNRVEAEFGLEHRASSHARTKRIDSYWGEISRMKDDLGNPQFPFDKLVTCLLSLSHANAAPDSGFSLNKAILAAHGNSLQEDTLVSLRIVKDAIRMW